MTLAPVLLVALVAPLVYFGLGYPVAARLGRPRLAPVVGLGLAGWACEWTLIARLPAWLPVLGLAVGAAVGWWRLGTAGAARTLRECYLVYTWPLAAVLLTPFPCMGVWSTDWVYVYQSGQAVMGHLSYGGPMLERPPLGGSSVIPLWLMADGLLTFQVWSAVASMALVLVAREVYADLGGTRDGVPVWLPLLASCFFLHHTMVGWAKFLAAGLTVGGLLLMHRPDRGGRGGWAAGSALFALAVATHQSAILYAPFALLFGVRPRRPGATLARLAVTALAGVVFVLPFELWTIATFGLDTKVNVNPAVAQRDPNESAAVRAGLMVLSTALPWNSVEDAAHWLREPGRGVHLYYLATGILTGLAGTLLGSALPFLPLRRAPAVERPWLGPLKSRAFLGCVLLAVVGNALLSPFYAKWGSAQTGLVPVQIFLYVVLIRCLDDVPERTRARVDRLALWLGIVPYGLLAVGMTVWLQTDPAAPATLLTWNDNDYPQLAELGGMTLALALYPASPVLAAGLCLVPFLRRPGTVAAESVSS
jgi:hypothetical protein